MMDSPLVSIVMPSMNQPSYIDAALDSILDQDYRNVELIVADGGSRAETIAILARRQHADARLRWFSRPDRGPAHALNDALGMVRGTIIGWLNSDDLYAPGAISRAVREMAANPDLLMVYGHGRHVGDHGEALGEYPTLLPSTPIQQFKEGCFICQPTMFFHRTAKLLLGSLDEQLKAAFDFDYWLRAFSAFPERIGFVDAVQAYSRLHDDCITRRMRRTVALEGMQVLAHYLGAAPKEWLLTYLDELMVLEQGATGIVDIRQHIEQTVDVASRWMTLDEKLELERAIATRFPGK